MHKDCIEGVYNLTRPENALPLVFDSPHSGTVYPDDFNHACEQPLLEWTEDKYVDELYQSAANFGAALLCAEFPRSYIDVNRCAMDIDEELLEGSWPHEFNASPRSHAGIGLIRRLIKPSTPLYARTLSAQEIQSRINTYYRPYHDILEGLLNDAHATHGQVWHINCHSMQSQGAFSGGAYQHGQNADFVLGDRDGTSCNLDFTHAIRDCLKRMGYRVAINDPYKGVELVRRYSAPASGRHSIQIEISKSLYMNEETFEKSRSFTSFQKDIEKLIAFCADYAESQLIPMAAD